MSSWASLPSRTGAQAYLYNQTGLATGSKPTAVVVGDFNGDGRLDLAVANQGDNTVSLFLSKPDGTFAPKVDYPVGNSPAGLAAADFNGDGKLDLAVVNSHDSTVSVLLGVGDGTFQKQVTYSTGASPVYVASADFNGDNHPDLAIANQNDGTISILLGKGDGSFASQTTVAVGPGPGLILTADFNGDAKQDLAVLASGANNDRILILLSNGDGTFKNSSSHAEAKIGGMAIGDFNGDGNLDLAASAPLANQIVTLLGNGDGTFLNSFSTTLNVAPYSLAAGDFNQDGLSDLAVAEVNGPPSLISVLLSDGHGTFHAPLDNGFPAGAPATSMVVGDFNNDGQLDLAATEQNYNVVSIWLGNGDGTLGSRTDVLLSPPGATAGGAAADFNRDGKIDLAVAQFTQTQQAPITGLVSVLPGKGNNTFQAPVVTQIPNVGLNQTLAGDFNGDGVPDLVMSDANANGGISVLLGNGDGTFRLAGSSVGLTGLNFQRIAAGDFNQDGKTDVVGLSLDSSNTFSGLYILLSNGDGTFHATLQDQIPFISVPNVVTADFNRDGHLDLAVSNGNNGILIYLGRGDGTFLGPTTYNTNSRYNFISAAADFNGDGKPDLAVGTDNGVLLFFAGNGDGTFQTPISTPTPNINPVAVAYAGDFNGDGNYDLAINGLTRFIMLGKGDGTFQAPIPFEATYYPRDFTVGDFNGDGIPDLVQFSGNVYVSVQQAPQYVSVWHSTPTLSFSASELQFSPQSVGSSSSPKLIAMNNTGNAPLSVSNLKTGGDFSETNNCSSPLLVGQGCSISVTFTPAANGLRSGTLTLTDNAYSGTQLLTLVGWAGPPDFAISASPASRSVMAGSSARYTVTVTPGGGFSGTVQVTCTGAPSEATCIPSPTSVTLSGTSQATVAVTINTTQASLAALPGSLQPTLTQLKSRVPSYALLLLVCIFLCLIIRGPRRRIATVVAGFLLCISCGCGGGSSAAPGARNPGTPPGTYNLTLSATSGNLIHTVQMSLTVM